MVKSTASSSRRVGRWWQIGCGVLLGLCGCLHTEGRRPPSAATGHDAGIAAGTASYRVASPDVVAARFASRPQWDFLAAVDLDGSITPWPKWSVRAEGLTLAELRQQLARHAGLPAEAVTVELVEPRSQFIFIHGPVAGKTKIVPYPGPEPVAAYLQRTGNLPPGTKLSQVYVVRPHVADGWRPYLYRIRPRLAVTTPAAAETLTLQPGDVIYIGETAWSVLARFLPHWLEPIYCRLMGLWPLEWHVWPFRPSGRPNDEHRAAD